jgi:hypothetical protein
LSNNESLEMRKHDECSLSLEGKIYLIVEVDVRGAIHFGLNENSGLTSS